MLGTGNVTRAGSVCARHGRRCRGLRISGGAARRTRRRRRRRRRSSRWSRHRSGRLRQRREREVEPLFLCIGGELHLGGHVRRKRGRVDARLEVGAVRRDSQREGLQLRRLPGRRVETLTRDDAGLHAPQTIESQRACEVVVDVQPEDAGQRIRPFHVMPGVGGHEELAPVTRIVIAVRSQRPLHRHRHAVGARAALEVFLGGTGAGPRQGHGDRHQLTAADRAGAGALGDRRRMNRTGPGGREPHGHERHLAERAGARRGLDDVGMVRTRHGQRWQRCRRSAAPLRRGGNRQQHDDAPDRQQSFGASSHLGPAVSLLRGGRLIGHLLPAEKRPRLTCDWRKQRGKKVPPGTWNLEGGSSPDELTPPILRVERHLKAHRLDVVNLVALDLEDVRGREIEGREGYRAL